MLPYSTRLLPVLSKLTTVEEETCDHVGQVLDEVRGSLEEIANKFRLQSEHLASFSGCPQPV